MSITNYKDVYNYLKTRGVTRLCHFTKIQNLVHIITSPSGILATQFIQPDIKKPNDNIRCDGANDHVCCSIEYPNSWYWRKLRERDEDAIFREWAILCIEPEIVKYRKIKFCPCNAAYSYGRFIEQDPSLFENLFKKNLNVGKKQINRPSAMLDCCPTDDQAEILIEHDIPLRYIKAIIVGNEYVADLIRAILITRNYKLDIYIAPDVCNTNWSNMVRQGIRPKEIKYTAD